MPSPTTWKKHTSLLLSRLRSKRAATGGSSLVVQAGFPTSLADLFVKNHKKILPNKKPNSKHNRPVKPNPNPISQPPVAAAVIYPNRTAVIDRSTSSRRSRRLGLGLGFLVVGLLAVGKKWVVVGITILSLVLLVLELFGLVEKKKPPRVEEDRAAVGVVDLTGRGLVSPIREASRCSDSESDVFSERSEISPEKGDFDGDRSSGSDVFLERRESLGEESDVSAERREIDDDRGLENSTKERRKKKKKKKKLFGKLFGRKCSRKKDEKEEKCPFLDDSGEKEEGIVDEDSNGIDEFLSLEDSDRIAEVDSEEEAAPVGENMVGTRTRLWRWIVFFVVVLFGLLGGKAVAVALTLAYVLVSRCTGTVWRRYKSE